MGSLLGTAAPHTVIPASKVRKNAEREKRKTEVMFDWGL